MSTFKIYFFGLICHIGRKPNRRDKRFATVFKNTGHGHRFELYVRDADVVKRIPLSDNVTFSLPPGTAKASPDFMLMVPSLDSILGGTLRPDIDAATATDVHYISYPAGGELGVADLYPCDAEHRGNAAARRNGCIARLTYLIVDTTGIPNVTIHSGQTHEIVGANDCILITHHCVRSGPPGPCGSNPSHGDFRENERLLIGAAVGDAREVARECDDNRRFAPHDECSWIQDVLDQPRFKSSVHVECGNTDYP